MKMKRYYHFYNAYQFWFAEILKEENEILLNNMRIFPKQTHRSRCNIYGNAKIDAYFASIHHNGKRAMKDLELSYAEDWQNSTGNPLKSLTKVRHISSIMEDKLKQIFSVQPTSLIEFNLNALKIILQILKVEKTILSPQNSKKHQMQ